MSKNLNHLEKKLKFHCFHCSTTWQLLVIRTDSLKDLGTKCSNDCSSKWEDLLIAYCQERQIIYFVSQEREKDEKSKELAEWLDQIKNHDKN